MTIRQIIEKFKESDINFKFSADKLVEGINKSKELEYGSLEPVDWVSLDSEIIDIEDDKFIFKK